MFTAHELAENSKKINIETIEYSPDTQTRFVLTESSSALSITWNGTQTYDFNGRPRDADNDN